jgi:hypothetical protein
MGVPPDTGAKDYASVLRFPPLKPDLHRYHLDTTYLDKKITWEENIANH